VLGDKWESPTIRAWIPSSAAEMSDTLLGTSNRSAPGPDHITWRHLKRILRDGHSERLFLWLANACLSTGVWPDEFKVSITVVIPKLGKPSYDTPKSFRPIVLLNTMGKLLEKMLFFYKFFCFLSTFYNATVPNTCIAYLQLSLQVIGEKAEGLYERQSIVTLRGHGCGTQPQRTGVRDARYGRPVRAKLRQGVGPQLQWLRRRRRSRVTLNRSGNPT
jgi:hypothetical protein